MNLNLSICIYFFRSSSFFINLWLYCKIDVYIFIVDNSRFILHYFYFEDLTFVLKKHLADYYFHVIMFFHYYLQTLSYFVLVYYFLLISFCWGWANFFPNLVNVSAICSSSLSFTAQRLFALKLVAWFFCSISLQLWLDFIWGIPFE